MAIRAHAQNLSGLIENPWLPASLAGGFLGALALAILSVSLLGDPFATQASLVVPIESKASSLGEAPAPRETIAPPAAPALPEPLVDHALLKPGPFGPVPAIAPDGRRALEVYARPFDKADPRPRIAIALSGLGMSAKLTGLALAGLPAGVTFSFSPYGEKTAEWLARARARGIETLLEIPMEPFAFPDDDPGPYALLAEATAPENARRLAWILSRAQGYAGVAPLFGEKFLSSAAALAPALAALREHGLYFLDASSSPASLGAKLASENALPAASADLVIDVMQTRRAIDDQLAALERLALRRGRAIGVAQAYPVTIERLAQWASTLDEKGIALAPVSAMLAGDDGPSSSAP